MERRFVLAVVLTLGLLTLAAPPGWADTAAQALPFSQDWTNTGLITTNDDWSGVPGIIAYRGDGLSSSTATNPQTVTADGSATPVNVIAQSTAASATGGVHEVEAAAAVALQGSGTADAPHLVLSLNTSGHTAISVSYNLRNLDAGTAPQQVALQYRVGAAGPYTDIPAGYVANASAAATTPVAAVLPAAADNQPLVNVRVITNDAPGSDTMTGVDDISVTGTPISGNQEIAADCNDLSTVQGTADSAVQTATDPDGTVVHAVLGSVTPAPASGTIALGTQTPATTVGGTFSVPLEVDANVPAGTYTAQITFTNNDTETLQTATCIATVTVVAVTPIHDIQGNGLASPIVGSVVGIDAVVTSLFENNDVVDSFFAQEEDGDVDADPNTSEGLRVFCGASCPAGLAVGDEIRAIGTVAETFGMTELTASATGAVTIASAGNAAPTAATVNLPAAGSTRAAATFENVEGMRVTIPQTLAVSEYFELARFGRLVLTAGGRPFQFTHDNAPSVAGNAAFLADLNMRRIYLDDNNDNQNDAVSGPQNNEPYPYPEPGLSVTNRLRGGDTITAMTGVLHWAFNAWQVRPVPDEDYTFTPVNPRPAGGPDVDGRLLVSSYNVLNFFTTIDTTASTSSGPCGPSMTLDCRGADSAAELARQLEKLTTALDAIRADIFGLIEIENDAADQSSQSIVDALNAAIGGGTYDNIATGYIGTDAIKVALIYDTATVAPVGPYEILDSSDNPAFIDTRNRPVLVQTFQELATGEIFTVALNHLKSKGSACTPDDPDTGDGQGNCNATRTAAAQALADFLASDPTGSGDPDFLIMGDLNAYRMEDPVTTLLAAGYVDEIARFVGDDGYSFLFDGQLGYLDHMLASPTLDAQTVDAGEWHINADEPVLFDYNDDVLDAGEAAFERESNALDIYEVDPYRTSDHDPALIGLQLNTPPSCVGATASPDRLWPPNGRFVPVTVLGVTDPNGDPITITVTSIFQDEPVDAGDRSGPDGRGVGTATAELRAERVGSGDGRVYTIGFTADDGSGGTCTGSATVAVPKTINSTAVDQGPLYDSTQG